MDTEKAATGVKMQDEGCARALNTCLLAVTESKKQRALTFKLRLTVSLYQVRVLLVKVFKPAFSAALASFLSSVINTFLDLHASAT